MAASPHYSYLMGTTTQIAVTGPDAELLPLPATAMVSGPCWDVSLSSYAGRAE